ncbi:MAG: alpha/beta hydrolase [Opitutaceae bacterium]
MRIAQMPSAALGRSLPLAIVEPRAAASAPATREPGAVLYFFHGRGRNHGSLLEPPATRRALLDAPFTIVLPQGEDGWHVDSPERPADRYETYLEEVIAWVETHRAVRRDAAGRGLAGWSMGGYGAVRFAQRHSGEFGFVASVIGLLDFPRQETLPRGQNYAVPVDRFGSEPAVWRTFNPLHALGDLRGVALALVLSETGFERTMNERFLAAASEAGLPVRVHRLEGGHEFALVQQAVPLVLADAAELFARPSRESAR